MIKYAYILAIACAVSFFAGYKTFSFFDYHQDTREALKVAHQQLEDYHVAAMAAQKLHKDNQALVSSLKAQAKAASKTISALRSYSNEVPMPDHCRLDDVRLCLARAAANGAEPASCYSGDAK